LKLKATSWAPIDTKGYQFDTRFQNKNVAQFIFNYGIINKINDIHLCADIDHVNAIFRTGRR